MRRALPIAQGATALAILLLFAPVAVLAAVINVNIGATTYYLGDGVNVGLSEGRGHNAGFTFPQHCAFTPNGTLYIADTATNRIRRVVLPRDNLVQNWMGFGLPADVLGVGLGAFYDGPTNIAVLANGTRAYVVEGHAVSAIIIAQSRKVRFVGSVGTPGTGDGVGTSARFRNPRAVDIHDSTGNLYIVEATRIRLATAAAVVTVHSGIVSLFQFADGTATTSRYNNLQGITIAQSSGIKYVTDTFTIRRVLLNGACTTLAGTAGVGHDDGPASSATFVSTQGIVIDKLEQYLYIADTLSHVIRRFDLTNMLVHTVVGDDSHGNEWTSAARSYEAYITLPKAACIDPLTQRLVVVGANSLSFVEMYTHTASETATASHASSLTHSLPLSLTDSLNVTATATLSDTHTASHTHTSTGSKSVTVTKSQTATDSISVVNCDVQFCLCIGVFAANLTAAQCAHNAGNCTNTRHCTERFEGCVVEALVPPSMCS